MSEWISVKDELPPIQESFKDGTNYHGEVEGWFAQFYKNNQRRTCLWSSDETEPRWMVNVGGGFGPAKIPPTHWRLYPDSPQ